MKDWDSQSNSVARYFLFIYVIHQPSHSPRWFCQLNFDLGVSGWLKRYACWCFQENCHQVFSESRSPETTSQHCAELVQVDKRVAARVDACGSNTAHRISSLLFSVAKKNGTSNIWNLYNDVVINTNPSSLEIGVMAAMASGLVRLPPDRTVLVLSLAGDIVLCSWARHITPTVPISTQTPLNAVG